MELKLLEEKKKKKKKKNRISFTENFELLCIGVVGMTFSGNLINNLRENSPLSKDFLRRLLKNLARRKKNRWRRKFAIS